MLAKEKAQEIVERNVGLFHTIANRHGPIGAAYDEDDIAQEMFVAALKRIEAHFDPVRGNESMFISLVCHNTLWRLRREWSRPEYSNCMDYDRPAPVFHGYFRALYRELRERVACVRPGLGEIVDMLYNTGGNVLEASRRFGIPAKQLYRKVEAIRNLPCGADIAAAI